MIFKIGSPTNIIIKIRTALKILKPFVCILPELFALPNIYDKIAMRIRNGGIIKQRPFSLQMWPFGYPGTATTVLVSNKIINTKILKIETT